MFKDYEDLLRQMEFEMQRCSAEAMRRLLECPTGYQEFWCPKADVYETEDEVVVRVEIAGVQRESLNVSLSSDRRVLSVSGFRGEKHTDERRKIRYHQLEVYFGSFERDIPLPHGVPVNADEISATYREGFLIVTLPKSPETQVSRVIPITEPEE